jgi:hypothetical protein
MEQQENINIFNDELLKKIDEIELNQEELDALYAYLSMFEETMTDEEKAFWSIILEKKDPEYYETYDEEDEDSDS